jgi:ElaB/YqjD/DUF883 family membrane-anchored ribosome-binding protein
MSEPISANFPPHPDAAAAEDPLADFKNLAGDHLKEITEKWETLTKEADNFIRENPGKSVLAALGIGLVLGLILKD